MLLCLLLFGAAVSAHSQDLQDFINEAGTIVASIGEITLDDETFLTHIVPSGMMMKKMHKNYKTQLSDILDTNNEYYRKFTSYKEKGHTLKGLTFNIYDDNMREAAIALFRMISGVDQDNFKKVKEWAKQNINHHMFDYAERLSTLYGSQTHHFWRKAREPPFLVKPNYYVNSETIIKTLKLKSNDGFFNHQDAKINQYYKTDRFIVINTNYSGWNDEPQEGCEEKIDYFTEDVSLNAYYYGLHLLHPFWLSNNELDEINPRQAEHYHFSHQQLLARYELEQESNKKQSNIDKGEKCYNYFNPYLIHDNGLPFPIRISVERPWNKDIAKLKGIDIVINEFISRGFFFMENVTRRVNLTADNYIELISKIIRANYENIETAKLIRSRYGYEQNRYSKNRYNPAPSAMHQPETVLRDPVYWSIIRYGLNYFKKFQQTLEPLDLSQYETNDIVIANMNWGNLTTYFEYYQFIIDKATETENDLLSVSFTARQRRLNHLPVNIELHLLSNLNQDVVIRLFIGPQCMEYDCWVHHNKFYQFDAWGTTLEAGKNLIKWSSSTSRKFSSDSVFNKEYLSTDSNFDAYNMFKFPENLLLPKGLEEGLNMTLFVIVTPHTDTNVSLTKDTSHYNDIYHESDEKPLGFPLHRHAINFNPIANNYRFYNLTIFHNKRPLDDSGNFSPHLY